MFSLIFTILDTDCRLKKTIKALKEKKQEQKLNAHSLSVVLVVVLNKEQGEFNLESGFIFK